MPGFDRTGPMGMGAMTGRGAGYCSGVHHPWSGGRFSRRGFGAGAGRGGWRNVFHATGLTGWQRFGPYAGPAGPPVPGDLPVDKEVLQQRYQALQSELEEIKKRLDDLA